MAKLSELTKELAQAGVTAQDLRFFSEKGKDLKDVKLEITALSTSPHYPATVSPALLDNHFLLPVALSDIQELLGYFDTYVINRPLQFVVPAAGAATRQVQLLRSILNNETFSSASTPQSIYTSADMIVKELQAERRLDDTQKATLKSLTEVQNGVLRFWKEGIIGQKYAFWDDLAQVMGKNGQSLEDCIRREEIKTIAKFIVDQEGLNYGNLPKLLMRIHSYKDSSGARESRYTLEEHLREAAMLMKGAPLLRLHFPISEEHESLAVNALNDIWNKENFRSFMKEQGFSRDDVEITWSYQDPNTDSVSIDFASKQIVRNGAGEPLLRKAGHGSLLPNISQLQCDGLWLQNVDNVLYNNAPIKQMVVVYKRLMAALSMKLESQAHSFIERLTDSIVQERPDVSLNAQVQKFLDRELLTKVQQAQLKNMNPLEVSGVLKTILDRPIVVAGYVPLKKGQAGGGPFVIETDLGGVSVCKVNTLEQAEFTGGADNTTFKAGAFFNPVEFFISKTRFDGSQYDLSIGVDDQRSFRSQKSDSKGNIIAAYERPGLWNGSMAKLLQVSIPIPSHTFSAIKDIAGVESFLSHLHNPYDGPVITDIDLERGVVDREVAEYLSAK